MYCSLGNSSAALYFAGTHGIQQIHTVVLDLEFCLSHAHTLFINVRMNKKCIDVIIRICQVSIIERNHIIMDECYFKCKKNLTTAK